MTTPSSSLSFRIERTEPRALWGALEGAFPRHHPIFLLIAQIYEYCVPPLYQKLGERTKIEVPLARASSNLRWMRQHRTDALYHSITNGKIDSIRVFDLANGGKELTFKVAAGDYPGIGNGVVLRQGMTFFEVFKRPVGCQYQIYLCEWRVNENQVLAKSAECMGGTLSAMETIHDFDWFDNESFVVTVTCGRRLQFKRAEMYVGDLDKSSAVSPPPFYSASEGSVVLYDEVAANEERRVHLTLESESTVTVIAGSDRVLLLQSAEGLYTIDCDDLKKMAPPLSFKVECTEETKISRMLWEALKPPVLTRNTVDLIYEYCVPQLYITLNRSLNTHSTIHAHCVRENNPRLGFVGEYRNEVYYHSHNKFHVFDIDRGWSETIFTTVNNEFPGKHDGVIEINPSPLILHDGDDFYDFTSERVGINIELRRWRIANQRMRAPVIYRASYEGMDVGIAYSRLERYDDSTLIITLGERHFLFNERTSEFSETGLTISQPNPSWRSPCDIFNGSVRLCDYSEYMSIYWTPHLTLSELSDIFDSSTHAFANHKVVVIETALGFFMIDGDKIQGVQTKPIEKVQAALSRALTGFNFMARFF